MLSLIKVLLPLLVFSCVNALYSAQSPVIELTAANFEDYVVKHPALWVVEFFAPWCGHCKALAPEYEKAAAKLKGLVRVGAIDCDVDANKAICGAHGIKGFPTLKIFKNSAKTGKKYSTDYQGERKSGAIVNVALSNLQSYLKILVDAGTPVKDEKKEMPLEKFMDVGKHLNLSHALFFSDKGSVANTLKALSSEFYRQLVIGFVDGKKAPKLVEYFKIEKFPTLLVLPVSVVDPPIRYEGEMKAPELQAFLRQYASVPVNGPKDQKKEEPPVKKEEPFNPKIEEISSNDDLKKQCLDHSLGVCIILLNGVEPAFQESLEAHNETLSLVQKVKKNLYDKGQKSFRFSWLNPLKFPKIVEDFSLAHSFPTLLAINPRKNLYRPFLYGFDEANIDRFLKELTQGIGRMFSYPGESIDLGTEIVLPTVLETDPEDDEDENESGNEIENENGKFENDVRHSVKLDKSEL